MKDSKNSIIKNYVFNVIYKLVNICMPLITAPYLSRTVGAKGVGIYAYYYAIAHYFYLFGKMGLNNYGTREIAISKDDSEKNNFVFSSIYLQQVIVSLGMIIMYIIFCLYSYSSQGIIPIILGLYTLGCLFDIDWLYLGLERFDKIAAKNIFVKVITLIAIFVFVKNSNDLWKYTLIMSLGMLIGFFTLWIGIKKNVSWTKVTIKDALKHIKPNFILLFPVLAANVYRSLDKVMVGKISGMEELGYYESAEKIIYAISMFITAFDNIMMPRCTNLIVNENIEKCKKYISNTMQFLFFIILLMGSVCFGLATPLVLIVFGKEFSASIILLEILAITLIFMVWSDVIRSLWIIPHKKDKIFVKTLTIGAIINCILNTFLIPKYGAVGACVATIAAELSVPVVQYIFFRKELDYKNLLIKQWIFVITAVITVIFIRYILKYFSVTIINLLILLTLGTICYITVCILLYAIFRKEDLVLYINIIKKFIYKNKMVKE